MAARQRFSKRTTNRSCKILENFENEDALSCRIFRSKAKMLSEARAGEHISDAPLKEFEIVTYRDRERQVVDHEREWPSRCDREQSAISRREVAQCDELGDDYVRSALTQFTAIACRSAADLCCYWFEKAREQLPKNIASAQACSRRKGFAAERIVKS